MMNRVSPLKQGFLDLSAVLFLIGGIISLAMSLLSLPIASIFPLTLPTSFSTVFLVVLGIGLICSLGAIHCYSLTRKRLLSEAGIRGIVFGALLLIISLGLLGNTTETSASMISLTANAKISLTALSAIFIMIAGAISFVLRHTIVSASSIAQEQRISQPSQQRF